MTAEHAEPLDHDAADPSDGRPEVGTVGRELALLMETLAERSSAPHPVVRLVKDHPDVVERAADTVVAWVRGAQDVLANGSGGGAR